MENSRTKDEARDILDSTVELDIVDFSESYCALTMVPMDSDRLAFICAPTHEFATHQQIKINEFETRGFAVFESGVPRRKPTDMIFQASSGVFNKTIEFKQPRNNQKRSENRSQFGNSSLSVSVCCGRGKKETTCGN